MKIKYREAGGFVGLMRGAEIDTASLSEDEAQRVIALVEQAGLVADEAQAPEGARDLKGYEIVIELEARRTVFCFDDATVPASANELLAYLQGLARPVPLEDEE